MADSQAIASQLSELTVMQVAELVKVLEDKWGVSAAAAAPIMVAVLSCCIGYVGCAGCQP